MWGFGKRKCKECGTELAEMEAVGDRVDDLMRASAMAAEPLQNICARCRVGLAKGTQSMTANLHEIEARRVANITVSPVPEPTVSTTLPEPQPEMAEPDAYTPTYSHGGGYKTNDELLEDRDEAYRQIKADLDQGSVGVLLDWLVTTKTGRTVALWLFLFFVFAFQLFDNDQDNSLPETSPTTEYSPPEATPAPADAAPAPPLPPPPPPVSSADAGRGPVPKGNPGNWITTNDYPSRALAKEQKGTTAFDLTISPEGRVSACQITQSSGHAELDKATCSLLTRRARFQPARDDTGQPTTGIWASRVRWEIPD